MDITKGYLRLFRQMLDWEWYDNPNVKSIFIHCLLSANVKAKKWRDMTIKRGQFVTSYEKLAAANGLTNQQTRTALKSLQLTNEIEYQSTNQYTVITVKNFNLYQADNIQKCEADIYPNNKREGGQITTTNNKDDYIKNSYISLSIEEREKLKKYIFAKKKNVKDADAYIRKLLDNGDIVNILEKAKTWNEKQKKKGAGKDDINEAFKKVTNKYKASLFIGIYGDFTDENHPDLVKQVMKKYDIPSFTEAVKYQHEHNN